MKFKLTKINVSKLYFIVGIVIVVSLPFYILIPLTLRYIIPSFSNVSIIHIALAFLTAYYIYNVAISKVSSEIIVKLNDKKLSINDAITLKENLKKITMTNKFSYYPKISIYLVDGTAIKFRIEKCEEYEILKRNLKNYKY